MVCISACRLWPCETDRLSDGDTSPETDTPHRQHKKVGEGCLITPLE